MVSSILSEFDPIQSWLDTPLGYYIDKPDFGNNLYELLYKNTDEARIKLHRILDKIEEDLGNEVSSVIDEVYLVSLGIDTVGISIRYDSEKFAEKTIKA